MKFQGIQILRAVAALAVVVSHLGSFAVQILHLDDPLLTFLSTHGVFRFTLVIFFAVSGFVMAHALRDAPPGEFLLMRLLRLFPTFWIAALGVLVLKLVAFGHYPADLGSILAGLFLLPGGERVHHLLGVEWTLIYELYFYLSITLFIRLGGQRGFLLGCGIWLTATLGRCAVLPNFGTTERPEWYHLPLSGWHIPTLLGVFAYQLRERGGPLPLGCKFLALTLLCNSFLFAPTTEVWLVLQAVSGALMVWWYADVEVSERHVLVRLGDASYGIYLLHAQIISLFFAVIHKRGWAAGAEWNLLLAALTLAVTMGFTYGWLEFHLYRKLRKVCLKRLRPTPTPDPAPLRLSA